MKVSQRVVLICFLFFITLTFSACGAREELPGGIGRNDCPPVDVPVSSPLLSFAESKAHSNPETNFIHILDIGREALLARVHLIRSAQKSISIQTIIWVNDEVGRLLIFELIEAAKRGVKVKLIVDHLASEQHVEVATFLASVHPNFELRVYNPVSTHVKDAKADPSFFEKLHALVFRFSRINQRMHNKLFVVDGQMAITGGRNYQNAYYDQARGMNYKDRDVMVVGPVVKEMEHSFEAFWHYKHTVALARLKDVRRNLRKGKVKFWSTRESFQLNGLFSDFESSILDGNYIQQLFVDPFKSVEQAEFLADEPGKNKRSFLGKFTGAGKITNELAKLVSEAQHSIYIQTPYLVLTNPAISLFQALRQDHPDIDIRISTNSLAATDSWYVYALSYKQKQTYLQDLNFKIYELKPVPGDLYDFMPSYDDLWNRPFTPTEKEHNGGSTNEATDKSNLSGPPEAGQPYFCLHAKSFVIDDEIAFIGSYNFDPRSENLNTEVGLVVRDGEIAALLKKGIQRDMEPQNSWVIAKRKMPLGLSGPNAIFARLSDFFPLIDLWPFRYTSSFELKNGKDPVEPGQKDFYKNFKDVGSFPQVSDHRLDKDLSTRGTKAFLGIVKPLL